MEQSLNNKTHFKERFISFLKKNRIKFFILFAVIFIFFVIFFIYKEFQKRENTAISEKYIKANFLIANGKNEEAINLYEEIILSKNKFYSALSLNAILEKNLINDQNTIINYFEILEKLKFTEDNLDLITLKKALFLLKNSDKDKSHSLLKKLIDKNSNFKSIAEEIINR